MLLRVPVKKLSTQMTSAPCCEQALAQMRAEEAGAAGDQDALFKMHECPSASAAFRSGGLPIRWMKSGSPCPIECS